MKPSLPFDDLYVPEPMSGCWLWVGPADADGYGTYKGKRAHRVSYLATGKELGSLEIDHKCRVRCCVNPAHLDAVTRQENATRRRLAMTHCKRGHLFTDENTRWHGIGARSCKDCARITGRVNDKKRPCGWERQRLAKGNDVAR